MIGHRFRFSRRRLLASGVVVIAVMTVHAMILGAIALLPARPSVRSLPSGDGSATSATSNVVTPPATPVGFPTVLQAIVDAADPDGVARSPARPNPNPVLSPSPHPRTARWASEFTIDARELIALGPTALRSAGGVAANPPDERIRATIRALVQAADDTLADVPLAASDRPSLPESPERLVFQHVLRSLAPLASTTVDEDPTLFLAILRLNDWPASFSAGGHAEARYIYSDLLEGLASRPGTGGLERPADLDEELAQSIRRHAGGPTRFSDQVVSRRAIRQSLDRSHDVDGRPTAFDPSPGDGRRATGPERLRSLIAQIREPDRPTSEQRWSTFFDAGRDPHAAGSPATDGPAIVPPRRRREMWSPLDGHHRMPSLTALERRVLRRLSPPGQTD